MVHLIELAQRVRVELAVATDQVQLAQQRLRLPRQQLLTNERGRDFASHACAVAQTERLAHPCATGESGSHDVEIADREDVALAVRARMLHQRPGARLVAIEAVVVVVQQSRQLRDVATGTGVRHLQLPDEGAAATEELPRAVQNGDLEAFDVDFDEDGIVRRAIRGVERGERHFDTVLDDPSTSEPTVFLAETEPSPSRRDRRPPVRQSSRDPAGCDAGSPSVGARSRVHLEREHHARRAHAPREEETVDADIRAHVGHRISGAQEPLQKREFPPVVATQVVGRRRSVGVGLNVQPHPFPGDDHGAADEPLMRLPVPEAQERAHAIPERRGVVQRVAHELGDFWPADIRLRLPHHSLPRALVTVYCGEGPNVLRIPAAPGKSEAMGRLLRLYPALLRTGFASALAYRAEFLVWVLTTNMPLINLALWAAVSRSGPVGSYGQADFVAYFLATQVVRLMTGCWVVWEITEEVRQGTLGMRLLRPVHPLLAYSAENVAATPLRAAVSLPFAVILLMTVGAGHLAMIPSSGCWFR